VSKPLRNPRLVIVTLTEHLTGRFDVQWLAELVVLTCRRCKYLLVVPASTPAPDLADVGAIHNRLVHPDHAPRP